MIDLTSSDPVWGVSEATGARVEILWPPGFELRTQPAPAIQDDAGNLIGVNGDVIDDAGGSGGDPVTLCSIGGRDYPLSP